MLGYAFKNLPAKYVFAGYGVRKGYTILTTPSNGHIVYDAFLYSYVDNYLSFFIQMEDGSYKSVDCNVSVPEFGAEDLMSKHLSRGTKVEDEEDYEVYDKDKLVGVFGLRDINTLMKQVDEMKKLDPENHDISLEAMLDVKKQYMGMEIMGIINSYNSCLKYDKDRITVPPISYGMDDPYKSLIGDEMDYFDFMSNKDSDAIIRDLKKIDDATDGIGNLKDGKSVVITKGENGETSSVVIKKTPKDE